MCERRLENIGICKSNMTLLFYPKHLTVLLRKQKNYSVGEDCTYMTLQFYVTKHKRSKYMQTLHFQILCFSNSVETSK